MIKAAVAGLKTLDKLPPDPKDLPAAIKTHLIDAGRLDQFYGEVLNRVVSMRKMLDEDRTGEIPQRDLELMREYVRRFVKDMSAIAGDRKRGRK